jgi:hypothetical protein
LNRQFRFVVKLDRRYHRLVSAAMAMRSSFLTTVTVVIANQAK